MLVDSVFAYATACQFRFLMSGTIQVLLGDLYYCCAYSLGFQEMTEVLQFSVEALRAFCTILSHEELMKYLEPSSDPGCCDPFLLSSWNVGHARAHVSEWKSNCNVASEGTWGG